MPIQALSRRELLTKGTTLSLAGVGMLVGMDAPAKAGMADAVQQDIDVLNVILGTEHEGIAAYQACIEAKLLQYDTNKTASLFQDHHKKHRDFLIQKVTALGGKPAAEKQLNEYKDDLDIVNVKTQLDALHLIVKLELGAANAYIGMLPHTNDHELVRIASSIAADEVMHWTTFSAVLRAPLPTQAMTFGV